MSGGASVKARWSLLTWAFVAVAAVGVAAVLYIIAGASRNPHQETSLKRLAHGEMAKLSIPAEATPAPPTSFLDAQGKPVRLADFKGQVVVLNLWATWCGPCKIEMPTLAALAGAYEGKPVAVVALSIDKAEAREKAVAFIASQAPLKFYNDPNMATPFALKPPVVGMPTTVIYGRDGTERARLSGDADWSGPDAKAVIDHILAEP